MGANGFLEQEGLLLRMTLLGCDVKLWVPSVSTGLRMT